MRHLNIDEMKLEEPDVIQYNNMYLYQMHIIRFILIFCFYFAYQDYYTMKMWILLHLTHAIV